MRRFKIVTKILAKLNISDSIQLENFIINEIDYAQQAIDDSNHNKKALALGLVKSLKDVDRAIADATKDAEESYGEISVEDIKSNAAMTAFRVEYWKNIREKESNLENLLKKKTEIKEEYDDRIKNIDEQIEKFNKRIIKLGEVEID